MVKVTEDIECRTSTDTFNAVCSKGALTIDTGESFNCLAENIDCIYGCDDTQNCLHYDTGEVVACSYDDGEEDPCASFTEVELTHFCSKCVEVTYDSAGNAVDCETYNCGEYLSDITCETVEDLTTCTDS